MACFSNCQHSNFGPYYPCDATTCGFNCSPNTVVNPPLTQNFAFLSLSDTSDVNSNEVVPVVLSLGGGGGITSTTSGQINITSGTYQASFNVSSLVGVSGEISFALALDGVVLASSVSTTSGTPGGYEIVANTIIFEVNENSVLTLVNNGTDAVSVNMANLTITRIN